MRERVPSRTKCVLREQKNRCECKTVWDKKRRERRGKKGRRERERGVGRREGGKERQIRKVTTVTARAALCRHSLITSYVKRAHGAIVRSTPLMLAG